MENHNELNPWNIVLLSTMRYLADIRNTILDNFDNLGICCRAFERALPENFNLNAINDCYERLRNESIDLAILIIDEHYGTIDPSNGLSITHNEYQTCLSHNIKVFKFIRSNVYNDYIAYKNNGFKKCAKINLERYDCFEKVMAFVRSIDELPYENNFNLFNDNNIYDCIRRVLSANTRIIIKEKLLSNSYINYVNRICTANNRIHAYPSQSNIYIQPSISLDDAEIENPSIVNTLNDHAINNRMLLVGSGGYGKTTLLKKMFFDQYDRYIHNDSPQIPLLFFMSGMNIDDLTIRKMIEILFEKVFRKKMYPFFSENTLQFILYLDGLDEISGNITISSIRQFLNNTSLFAHSVVVSCRKTYAFNYSIIEHFDHLVEIKGYLSNTVIDTAIRKYFSHCESTIDTNTLQQIRTFILGNQNIFRNPFMLFLYLNYAREHGPFIGISNTATIIQRCLQSVLSREARRLEIYNFEETSLDNMMHILGHIAWSIYCNRLNGNPFLKYNELIAQYHISEDRLSSNIIDLFLNLTSDGYEVMSMTNENLMEFFCGQYLYYILTEDNFAPEYDNIDAEYYYYTNVKVEIIHRCIELMNNEDRQKAFKYLYEKYITLRGTNEYKKITWILNLMLRTKAPQLREFIEKEYQYNKSKSRRDINKLSIEHCIIQLGFDKKVEQRFINNMLKDKSFDKFVRGCYLIYYEDSFYRIPFPYDDDGSESWERCFIAFKAHINEPGNYRNNVRRLEFRLAEQFILARPASQLTQNIVDFYLHLPREKYNFCRNEYNRLCSVIKDKISEKS